jgi:ribosomal protein S18 acetylase RimI-like enzyme
MVPAACTPEVEVREFRLEDYEAVLDLWIAAGLSFRPRGRDRRDRLAAELTRGRAVFLVAESEGYLVGTVLGTHDGRKGWINRLAVVPEWQRRGIARLLVGEVETRLEALGLEITAALVETPNEGSLRFFRAIGYVHDPQIEYLSRRRSSDT